jgi:hypothetical protein
MVRHLDLIACNHFTMRVRTRNTLIAGGVITTAIAGFLYPLVYLKYFAQGAMKSSAEQSLPGGHTIRGAYVNSGMPSEFLLFIHWTLKIVDT